MKAGEFQIQNASKGTTGKIIMTGLITTESNAANSIRGAIDVLNADPKTRDILIEIVNCYGGSVYEGVGTMHYIRESAKPIRTKVVGIAASMAFPIFLAGVEREMVRGSRIMSHEVKGGIMGSADQIESYAKEVKQLNADLTKEIAEMTGKDEAYVIANLMRPGVDTYLTADQCYKLGIATKEPKAGVIKQDIPQNVLESTDPVAVFNYYQKQIENSHKPKNMEKLPLMAAALGLSTDATENQVLEAVQKVVNAKAALETKNETLTSEKATIEASLKTLKDEREAEQTTQIDSIVASALTAGKIKKEQEESLKAWAKADFVAAKGFLESIEAPHTPVTAQLNQGAAGAPANELAGKSYKELIMTPEGSAYLENLMKTDKPAFEALKKASYPGA